MPIVTLAAIKKRRRDRKPVKVNTPLWGEDTFVYVRMLSAAEAAEVEHIAQATTGKMAAGESLVRWCIMGACDANGKSIFQEADEKALLDQPVVPLRDIFNALMSLNGVDDRAAKN